MGDRPLLGRRRQDAAFNWLLEVQQLRRASVSLHEPP